MHGETVSSNSYSLDYFVRLALVATSLAGIHFVSYVRYFSDQFWEVIDASATSTYFATLGAQFLICFMFVRMVFLLLGLWSHRYFQTEGLPPESLRVQALHSVGRIVGFPYVEYFVSLLIFTFFYFAWVTSSQLFGLLALLLWVDAASQESSAISDDQKGHIRYTFLCLFGIMAALALGAGRAEYMTRPENYLIYETDTQNIVGKSVLSTGRGLLVYTSQDSVAFIPYDRLKLIRTQSIEKKD
jgi:hypothetical protein